MDIITETGEIWSENAIGAVISLIKESDDSIEAERKLTHWLTEMNCQLIAMALARIDTELYQIYNLKSAYFISMLRQQKANLLDKY